MSTEPEPPIVVGIGLTEESNYVLEKVVGLTGDPSRIIAVHVLEHASMNFADDVAGTLEHVMVQQEAEAERRLNEICKPFGITDARAINGQAAHVLHHIAEQTSARCIVIGTHGLRGWRAWLGETADAVLHDTRNSVLAILTRDFEGKPSLTYNKIVIAVDLSEESDEIIEAAKWVGERFSARCVLLSVITPLTNYAAATDGGDVVYSQFIEDYELYCKQRLESLAETHNIEEILIHHGHPPSEIHNVADSIGADLIVVGTHGTHGPALLLGSTPSAVLHGTNCDVLAVRVGI